MKKKLILFILIFIVFFNNNSYAHDNEKIHPDITKKSAKNSMFEEYLKTNLNFKNGLETQLPTNGGNNILYLLQEGSLQEDDPMCRASNHFHDSMKTWDVSATSGHSWLIWLINQYCSSWSPYYSDITWATGFTDPASTAIPYNPNNEKSPNMWANARTLYFNALTSTNQTTRENNFAKTFKVLGHVMHILQEVVS